MNNIIVISGPSGSGKSTLIRFLLKDHSDIIFSVSHTTRPRRGKEVDGKHYHFVSHDQFRRMIDNNAFVEWAEVHNNYYGTGFAEIDDKLKNPGNRVLVLDLDVQGAKNIKEKFPEALLILVTPPTLKELETRLIRREKAVNRQVEKRLQMAEEELKKYKLYDYIIINDNLEQAYSVLNAIFTAFKNTTARNEARIKRIIAPS